MRRNDLHTWNHGREPDCRVRTSGSRNGDRDRRTRARDKTCVQSPPAGRTDGRTCAITCVNMLASVLGPLPSPSARPLSTPVVVLRPLTLCCNGTTCAAAVHEARSTTRDARRSMHAPKRRARRACIESYKAQARDATEGGLGKVTVSCFREPPLRCPTPHEPEPRMSG